MSTIGFNRYFKLYLKCILRSKNYAFINNHSQHAYKNESLLLDPRNLYYTVLHLKFSSLLYSTQLADIFSYEVPRSKFSGRDVTSNYKYHSPFKGVMSVVVYNFHILNTQERLYIYLTSDSVTPSALNILKNSPRIASITELFFAANWLEREVAELSGIIIKDKKDLRNLMLQYGDSSAPFQKSFPSIGLKEMFYNPIKDTITQNPVSLQL